MPAALNLLDPDLHANPYPHYAAIQDTSPVCIVEPFGFFGVTRYDDVVSVLKRPEIFSSRAMTSMLGDLNPVPDALTLIATDPPVHTRLRTLVNRAFTPRAIAALEPRIRKITRAALDGMTSAHPFELIGELGIPLPVTVIAELLGIPAEDQQDFKRWSDDIVQAVGGMITAEDHERIRQSIKEFQVYFEETVARRRLEPTNDVLSDLIRAEEDGLLLSATDVMAFSSLLLVAGNETTTNLLGNAVVALLENPMELSKVRANPGLIPGLIEETLRYDNPVQCLFRQTLEEVTLGDVTIPEGAMVMPFFAAANRDPEKFPDPHTFDVTRNAVGHLGFGFGIHFCLGAPLARLEARVMLEVLLARAREFTFTDSKVEYIESLFLRGPKRLPLTCRERPLASNAPRAVVTV